MSGVASDQPVEETSAEDEEQERSEVMKYIQEFEEKLRERNELREKNLNRHNPSESYFFKLDSSLKKNTAFVKKLKQFTTSQLESLIKDMSGLNLTKYISEVSQAIVEAKLKMSDIPSIITLCSSLHQIYSDFATHFLESWQKVLTIKPGEKVKNASKMRVDLKFYCELLNVGIFTLKTGLPLLGQVLTNLINQDKDEHSNISIILSFCKHVGEEFAGLQSRRILMLAKKYDIELPASTLLPPEKQQNLRSLLRDYHQTLCKHLKKEHKELQDAERWKRRAIETRGEIPNDKREQLELMTANFDKLYQSSVTFSDLLNENIPELPKDIEQPTEGTVIENEEIGDIKLDPWGDEDTKSFYVDLPDLRQFLPNYQLVKKEPSEPLPEVEQVTEEALDDETAAEPELNIEEQAIMMEIEQEAARPDIEKSAIEKPAEEEDEKSPEPADTSEASDTKQEQSEDVTPASAPKVPEKLKILGKSQLDSFLAELPNCVNHELIDSAAIEFLLNFNNKPNRKRLIKALFNVHRTRLDLLPLLGRFCAIINLVSSDVPTELAQMLKVDFKYQVKKRDQINIESKVKVVRYIGELVKFTLYSRMEALMCLKYLLSNFQHHHIEMTCAFIEVCGMYLYNCRDSRMRMNAMLETMMRLKKAISFDNRHAQLIENSYYLVKPPEGGTKIKKKIRTPLQEYIRYLIFHELHKSNVEKIVKYLRRLDWNDSPTAEYVVKCLTKAYIFRWHMIRPLADVVSALSSYQEKEMTRVIDLVFEDIRSGLEIHSPKLAQRRIAMAKYLGELYIYRLIDSQNVFNTLYSIISYGVTWNHEVISPVDPPESLFRLKLACTLLDTCGSYFQSSSSKKKLDCFLVFLQNYYWFKKSHPIFSPESESGDLFPHLIEHMYKECMHNLRPKTKLYKSFEASQEAVEKLRKQIYPNLSETGAGDGDGRMLNTINENESDDYTSEAVGSDDEVKPRSENEEFPYEDDFLEDSSQMDDLKSQEQKDPEICEEDAEFESMFEKMQSDSLQERAKESAKVVTRDIPVPMTTRVAKKTYDQLQEVEPKPQDTLQFMLMVRNNKSGKQQFKNFMTDSESELAKNLKLREEKIRLENERVKQLTLNITERMEETDYQESLQARPASFNKKQPKFKPIKHQKGVPNIDF